ncbi:TRAP transporter large permease [Pseudonocardia lacus]|uniref:TRAP transporter large permease n=1 Tax=Pseudonocardia lacus TaxID=2835865 RepID=UPI001BDBE5A5|nr:TRAP transporter large permease [Pseudonocardia lacus]
MNLLLLSLVIIALLALRVPVAFCFLGPCLGYLLLDGQSLGSSLRLVVNATASFPLLAVPLFVLLGVLASRGGIADLLFDFALAVLGRVRGGLGYVSVGVSLGFSWMSGSAVADAAALGKIQIPAMLRAGYPLRFGLGVTGSAALIAPVMPPSIPAVIFAGAAAVSTGALFAASVIPALLMALGLCVVVFVLVRRTPDIVPVGFSWARVRETGRRVIAPIGAPVVILGGILTGAFTPTEAAAVGVAYILVLAFAYRRLRVRDLPGVLAETVVTTAGIMLIVASASLLGYILAREQVPQALTEGFFGLTDDATVFMVLVAVLMLVLGTVIDPTAVLVLVVPILLPISSGFGVDPIVLGVLMIVSLMIGLLTPPVGTVLYVLSSVARTRVGEVFRGSLPFIVPLLVLLAGIIAFPDAVLWLPRALGL